MKLEIYQVGKLPPLTVVECESWRVEYDYTPRLICSINEDIAAMFNFNNIAGFKEVSEDND